jgi:ribosome-associated heat shock protein Hsp15
VSHAEAPEPGRVRIDKWLWAARFFKTRSLATVAVDGGKVHLNGSRVRAARSLKPGDQLKIRSGLEEVEVLVLALSDRRGPAAAAQALYAETEASVTRRLALAEERRALATAAARPPGRPDKKSRRAIIRFTRGGPS